MEGTEGLAPAPEPIHCWSGPRCVSTSLMYAWAQRDDTQVLDEPLYAHYLTLTGAPRPYTELVLQSQDADGNRVLRKLVAAGAQQQGSSSEEHQSVPFLYCKHMAKHRIGIRRELMRQGRHFLLVREPEAVIQSFSEVLEPTLQETCYPALLELYSELRSMGRPPPVVLSSDLVRDPEGMLRALCCALGLPFQHSMLSWQSGPKPYDGVWSPWWYAQSHRSTGFSSNVSEHSSGQAAASEHQQQSEEQQEEEKQQQEQGRQEEQMEKGERRPRQLPPNLQPQAAVCSGCAATL